MLKTGLKSQKIEVNSFTAGSDLWDATKLSSYGSRPCPPKTRVQLTGCAIDVWTGACPTGISFQVLVFSFHSLYLTAATGAWKRKEIQKGKGHFLLCLTLCTLGSVIQVPGHDCLCGPSQLSWTLAARSSWAVQCLAQCFCSGPDWTRR